MSAANTVELGSIAKLIRSKNAGPWMLTIDVMLPDEATYRRVLHSGVLSAETVGRLLGIDPAAIEIYEYEPASTVKLSFPRTHPNGDPADTDVFGGQQFAPLFSLPIPA